MNMKKLSTILLLALVALSASAQGNEQLYNMSFDNWSKTKGEWCLWSEGAGASRKVWGTANRGLSILGKNCTEPEEEIVAVKGPGKKACKLHSEKVLWAFAAGNLYNGNFVKVVGTSGAELNWGVPFSSRPKSLSGYYYYLPKTIDYAQKPYTHLKGKGDEASIEVILADWDAPQVINTKQGKFVDVENDPHIIGRGVMYIKKGTDGYVRFNLPIEYRNERTPRYVVVIACSSRYGGDFTGGDGSTLYVDEFSFKY